MFLYYKIQSAPEYCNVIYLGVKAKIYIEYRREIGKSGIEYRREIQKSGIDYRREIGKSGIDIRREIQKKWY